LPVNAVGVGLPRTASGSQDVRLPVRSETGAGRAWQGLRLYRWLAAPAWRA